MEKLLKNPMIHDGNGSRPVPVREDGDWVYVLEGEIRVKNVVQGEKIEIHTPCRVKRVREGRDGYAFYEYNGLELARARKLVEEQQKKDGINFAKAANADYERLQREDPEAWNEWQRELDQWHEATLGQMLACGERDEDGNLHICGDCHKCNYVGNIAVQQ